MREVRIFCIHLFDKAFNGFIGTSQISKELILLWDGQGRGDLIAQTRSDGLLQVFGEAPFLCKGLVLPDLFSIAKFGDELRVVIEDRRLEIIRFARQMPEMETDGGAVAFGFP